MRGGGGGGISLKRDFKMSFAFEKTPRISLTCKLVPVQYREYENGLLPSTFTTSNRYYWLFSDPGMGLDNFSICLSNPISFLTLFTDSSLQVPVQPVVFIAPRQENQDYQRGQPSVVLTSLTFDKCLLFYYWLFLEPTNDC